MMLLVIGNHLDVQDALKKLGRSIEFFVVSDVLGLDEYAIMRYEEGRALVLPVGGTKADIRAARRILEDARERGIDLIVETLYPLSAVEFAQQADLLYIGGKFFKPEGVIP